MLQNSPCLEYRIHYKAEERTEYHMHHKPTVTIMFYFLNFFRHVLLTDCNHDDLQKRKTTKTIIYG